MAHFPFPLSMILPYPDPGAKIEISLKTGEAIRGMLLRYDEENITIQPFDSEDNFLGSERVINHSEIMGL